MHNDFNKLSKMKEFNNGNGIDKITLSSFDLDSTLIKTKSGRRFGTDKDDWKFIYSNDRMKRKMTGSNTSVICIISNQLGVSKGKVNDKELMHKFTNIVNSLSNILEDKFICIFGAFQDDLYRKPRTESLEYIVSVLKPYANFNSIDYDNSYYVGDASGCEGDFSDVDYKFALNAGLKFYDVDEFLGDYENYYPKPFHMISDEDFGSYDVKLNSIMNPTLNINLYEYINKVNRLIILVGSPASGKTSLANSIKKISTHTVDIISQDTLKTVAKCKKAAISFIKDNVSTYHHTIVIDNTNRDIKTRKIWIDLAKEHNYNPLIFYLTTEKDKSTHLNMYRSLQPNSDKKIPAIALNVFYAKLEKPSRSECELYEFELKLDRSLVNDLIYSYLY
jgi:bifunctional polynucleotide phosphatase/kinase